MTDFLDSEIQIIWEKAKIVKGYHPDVWRKDQCGAWINRESYGDRQSEYGWECDHITPTSKGGSDWLFNIRPLHWKNNASRQDGKLITAVTALGPQNVEVK